MPLSGTVTRELELPQYRQLGPHATDCHLSSPAKTKAAHPTCAQKSPRSSATFSSFALSAFSIIKLFSTASTRDHLATHSFDPSLSLRPRFLFLLSGATRNSDLALDLANASLPPLQTHQNGTSPKKAGPSTAAPVSVNPSPFLFTTASPNPCLC